MQPQRFIRACLMSFAVAAGVVAIPILACAQDVVNFPAVEVGGADSSEKVSAALSRPRDQAPGARLPAVVLLHSAWGWSDEGVTGKYAEALSKAGFIALEVHMFANSAGMKQGGPVAYLPYAFGALKYLVSRPDVDPRRIGVAGYSFGGLLAFVAATTWATERFSAGGSRFAAYAPFYPICWIVKANAKGRQSPVPTEAWRKWTGAPVRIYAGALDDYDDKDPGACQDAVDSLPEDQRKAFSVRVFPNATHGWDQTKSASFFEKLACKGRGCNNANRQNPEATEESIKDLIGFFGGAMPK
jgi:dienelactone hydrolase